MPPDRLRFCLLLCAVCFACQLWSTDAASQTLPRFTASYQRRVSTTVPALLNAEEMEEFARFAPELSALRHAWPSRASSTEYVEFSTGTADIDNLNSIFRFNITYLNYSTNGVGVQNSKPRSTTLLMYDVVLSAYNSSHLYRPGTNFTWSSPNCGCSPISAASGGGSPPLLFLPSNADDDGTVNIVVNKKPVVSKRYTYEAIGFVASEAGLPPVTLPIAYTFYLSTTQPSVLDRVSFTMRLKSGVASTVTMDFWQREPMAYSSIIVPDTSCRKDCFDAPTTSVSVRAQPISFYPTECVQPSHSGCYCVNRTVEPSGFCNISWPISAEIDFQTTLNYAIYMKNLTVDGQATPIASECVTQMTDFICRFYFPPCNEFGARMRPPINGTLNCFRDNPLYFNNDGTLTTAAMAEFANQGPIASPTSSSTPFVAPIIEPIATPIHSTPPPEIEAPSPANHPQPPIEPSVPIVPMTAPSMSSSNIDYAVSFAIFSSYDVAAKKTVTYPDIYTLKNWQIALMLFGSIALILTIIVSIVMANRRVVPHYEKIAA